MFLVDHKKLDFFFFHLCSLKLLIRPLILNAISQRCVLIAVTELLILGDAICFLRGILCLSNYSCFYFYSFVVVVIANSFFQPEVLLPVFSLRLGLWSLKIFKAISTMECFSSSTMADSLLGTLVILVVIVLYDLEFMVPVSSGFQSIHWEINCYIPSYLTPPPLEAFNFFLFLYN